MHRALLDVQMILIVYHTVVRLLVLLMAKLLGNVSHQTMLSAPSPLDVPMIPIFRFASILEVLKQPVFLGALPTMIVFHMLIPFVLLMVTLLDNAYQLFSAQTALDVPTIVFVHSVSTLVLLRHRVSLDAQVITIVSLIPALPLVLLLVRMQDNVYTWM